jgi:hypothetical protein
MPRTDVRYSPVRDRTADIPEATLWAQQQTHGAGDTPGPAERWWKFHGIDHTSFVLYAPHSVGRASASWPENLAFVSLRFQSIQSVRVFERGYLTGGNELLLHRGWSSYFAHSRTRLAIFLSRLYSTAQTLIAAFITSSRC